MEQEQLKGGALEFLKNLFPEFVDSFFWQDVIKAMEDYSAQQNQQLQKENKEIKESLAYHISQMKRFGDWLGEKDVKILELQAEKEKLMSDYMAIQTELNRV